MAGHPLRRTVGFLGSFLLLFFVVAFALAFYRAYSGRGSLIGGQPVVALVHVRGEITRSDDFVETLRDLRENDGVGAIVVRIDSPGGAVAPSQEMYSAVREISEVKPIVASLGAVAASGGYYVASAADAVVASPGTLTGSIGVILTLADVTGLLDKLGVQARIVTAGTLKDMGSPLRPMTLEEQALFQQMADQVHEQFIEAVAAGRSMDPAEARRISDGRILTGQQAQELGLVDELGGLADAIRIAASRGGIVGEPTVREFAPSRAPWWWRALVSDDASQSSTSLDALHLLGSLLAVAGDGGASDNPRLLWRLPIVTEGFRW
jgi:protease-4